MGWRPERRDEQVQRPEPRLKDSILELAVDAFLPFKLSCCHQRSKNCIEKRRIDFAR
jgi:hypothetical protein